MKLINPKARKAAVSRAREYRRATVVYMDVDHSPEGEAMVALLCILFDITEDELSYQGFTTRTRTAYHEANPNWNKPVFDGPSVDEIAQWLEDES